VRASVVGGWGPQAGAHLAEFCLPLSQKRQALQHIFVGRRAKRLHGRLHTSNTFKL